LGFDKYKIIVYLKWWYAKESFNRASFILGDVSMPKGFEIDRDKLSGDILQSTFIHKQKFPVFKRLGQVKYLY
jgi:hypothetical protein